MNIRDASTKGTTNVLIVGAGPTGLMLACQLERYGISYIETDSGLSATLKRSDGMLEEVKAEWLVGADGARSVVRHTLGIPFEGKTYPDSLFVLDCQVDMPFRQDEAYVAFSDRCFAAVFPMTEGRCRIISMLPEELLAKEEIAFADVAKDFGERMQMDVRLSDPKWLSVYHAHHRYATVFRQGRCFLAGDAAHIHSPVGGQGMNTGLQDAHNLAWKLALVILGQGKLSLLETYSEERLPIAKNLVRTTDRAFSMTVNKNPLARSGIMFAAPKALALLLKEKHFRKLAFTTISQTGIGYRKSSLSRLASFGTFPRHAPMPGDRLPFIEFYEQDRKINIQNKVNAPGFHLFLFPGPNAKMNFDVLQNVAQRFDGAIVVETIPLSPDTKPLYEALGIQDGGYYLIRPDMFIAYRSAIVETEHFEQYLERFLNPLQPTQQVSLRKVIASMAD